MNGLHFKRGDFTQPADMTFFLCKLGGQEGIHQFSRDNETHHPAADAEDVHIVVLDSLVSRVVVLHQPGTHSRNLVGTDRGADAAAADG